MGVDESCNEAERVVGDGAYRFTFGVVTRDKSACG